MTGLPLHAVLDGIYTILSRLAGGPWDVDTAPAWVAARLTTVGGATACTMALTCADGTVVTATGGARACLESLVEQLAPRAALVQAAHAAGVAVEAGL